MNIGFWKLELRYMLCYLVVYFSLLRRFLPLHLMLAFPAILHLLLRNVWTCIIIKGKAEYTAPMERAAWVPNFAFTKAGNFLPLQWAHHISKVLLTQRTALEAEVVYDLNWWWEWQAEQRLDKRAWLKMYSMHSRIYSAASRRQLQMLRMPERPRRRYSSFEPGNSLGLATRCR